MGSSTILLASTKLETIPSQRIGYQKAYRQSHREELSARQKAVRVNRGVVAPRRVPTCCGQVFRSRAEMQVHKWNVHAY